LVIDELEDEDKNASAPANFDEDGDFMRSFNDADDEDDSRLPPKLTEFSIAVTAPVELATDGDDIDATVAWYDGYPFLPLFDDDDDMLSWFMFMFFNSSSIMMAFFDDFNDVEVDDVESDVDDDELTPELDILPMPNLLFLPPLSVVDEVFESMITAAADMQLFLLYCIYNIYKKKS